MKNNANDNAIILISAIDAGIEKNKFPPDDIISSWCVVVVDLTLFDTIQTLCLLGFLLVITGLYIGY